MNASWTAASAYIGSCDVQPAMKGNDRMLQRVTGLRVTGLLMAAMLCAAGASAQESAQVFDPSKLKGPAKGAPNEVLVLGTAHLKYLPATFQPASLRILNERLLAWRPRIIAIERLSGTQCAFMRQYPDRYKDSVQTYCWDTAPARTATGLDVPAATFDADPKAAAAAIGKAWDNPATAKRRQMDERLHARLGDADGVMACIAPSTIRRRPGLFSTATSAQRSKKGPRNNSAAATSCIGRRATCAWRPTSGRPSATCRGAARWSLSVRVTSGIWRLT
jgi:hypothetical protein